MTASCCADPRSPRQPDGPDGLGQRYDQAGFRWSDGSWPGRTLPGSVIYELHVGTFTAEGTFDAAIEQLDYLASSASRTDRADAGRRVPRHARLGL